MKRTVVAAPILLVLLAAAGFALPQEGDSTAVDERPPVIYAFDPTTGEPLVVRDIDPLFFNFNPSETSPRETSGIPIVFDMVEIAVIPTPVTYVLSSAQGFDFDHDGQREFIITPLTFQFDPFEFYESIADNTFVLVHVLDLENSSGDGYFLADAGDIDDDGLADLVVRAQDRVAPGIFEYGARVYESVSTDTYPTELVWDVVSPLQGWWHGGLIADTDVDGKQEIVVKETGEGLVVYENDGDNSYVQTYSTLSIGLSPQSMEVLSDLDGDGRDEILLGGLGSDIGKLVAFESTGDNAYELVWSVDIIPKINVEFIVDGGDLDNDGRKEFLAGGLKPGAPFELVIHLLEAISDNDFQIVATFIHPYGTLESVAAAAIADVDGDGRREIVFGSGDTLRIYKNIGDNSWEQAGSINAYPVLSIGAGDHDQDGKDEIIVRDGGFTNGFTVILEIDPADAADFDGDGTVDVVDNCPLTANPNQDDADGDAVGDVCDNCIYGPNPTQGPAIFGQEILALDSETFSWSEPAEFVYASGDLALVSAYTVDLVQTLPLGISFVDFSVPATSQGFFYLVKPDCSVGSWQTILGAEPGRDAVLP